MRSKKIASLATAAALMLGMTACAPGADGGDSGSSTVTWWVPNWNEKVADTMIAKFKKERPDITVEKVITTWDTMGGKIKVALDSGTGPDLIDELTSRISRYSSKDQLLDITDWFDSSMPVDDFYQSAIAASSWNDKIYAVPYRWDAGAMVYNKDIFAEAGITTPPTTTAELEAAAKAIKTTGINAFGWPLGNDNNAAVRWLNEYYTQSGDFKVGSDGAVTIDAAASQRALQNLGEGFSDGYATPSSFESDNTGLQNLLINKQIAFYYDGAYAVDPIKKAGINIGTAMWPGPDGPATVSADGFSFMVPKKAKNIDAVKALTQFLAQPENQVELTLTFPGRLSASENEKFASPLLAPFLEQQTDYAKSMPTFLGWDSLVPTIYSAVQSVGLGDKSAKEANSAIVEQAAQLRNN